MFSEELVCCTIFCWTLSFLSAAVSLKFVVEVMRAILNVHHYYYDQIPIQFHFIGDTKYR